MEEATTTNDQPVDVSDGICAYLQGGLGNQLFILAAAWAQARRLDCPLYVDASRFVRRDRLELGYETAREFDLSELDLPGRLLTTDSPWLGNSPRRPVVLRRPGRRSHRLRVYREPAAGGPDRIASEVVPGTTLLGYFQSPRYFDRIADDVITLISAARFSASDAERLTALDGDKLTVHLRRGDYLRPDVAAHHGMVSTDYVARALRLLGELTGRTAARVYTDSPEVVAEELAEFRDVEIFDPASLGTLATIVAMSRGRGFVMSNSSFSWWGAFLMSTRIGAPVVGPRPWLASGDAAADLLARDWLTIGAR